MVTRSLAAIVLMFMAIGCGRSPEPEPAAVRAPADTDSTAPPPATGGQPPTTPPGTLELPANFDPETAAPLSPVTPGSAVESHGLEMPPLPPGTVLPTAEPRTTEEPNAAGASGATGEPAGSGDVSLQAADWDRISQTISQTGKVTVVDFWSLACDPCIKEFPGLVALHRDLGDRVACFSVDVDYDGRKTKPAESYRPRVESFLQSVGATFPNFLSETASDELFSAVGIDSIPAVLIFDADGKLVRTFSDVGADAGFTYAENVRPFVQQLLAQKS